MASSHNLILKMTQHVTSQPDVKDAEKIEHKWKPCDICSLIYQNKRHDCIIKTLNSNFLMGRFISPEYTLGH